MGQVNRVLCAELMQMIESPPRTKENPRSNGLEGAAGIQNSGKGVLPASAIRFYRSGRFDRRIAFGGIPGVLVAAFVVKELPLGIVKWVVVGVLLYTSITLWMSSRREPASRREAEGNDAG